jgi:hypothetical protein
MKRIAFSLCVLFLSAFLVVNVETQAGDKEGEGQAKKKEGAKEGEGKGKEAGKKGRPKAAIFQSIDEKANTITIYGGEKGDTTYPLTNPFKVVFQADEGKAKDAKVADLKSGQPVGLKMNAEGKAVEMITILRKGQPEGKEAPAPKRPEGKEAPAPKRPEGKEAPALKRPEGDK